MTSREGEINGKAIDIGNQGYPEISAHVHSHKVIESLFLGGKAIRQVKRFVLRLRQPRSDFKVFVSQCDLSRNIIARYALQLPIEPDGVLKTIKSALGL